jgi:hypothetical protein
LLRFTRTSVGLVTAPSVEWWNITSALRPPGVLKGARPMTATAFELPMTTRHSDVAMALLSAIDVRDLERREAEISAREAEVLRREKAIDAVERIHELRGRSDSPVAVVATVEDDSPHREERQARRAGMKDALRLRERDWWIKILGIAPQV